MGASKYIPKMGTTLVKGDMIKRYSCIMLPNHTFLGVSHKRKYSQWLLGQIVEKLKGNSNDFFLTPEAEFNYFNECIDLIYDRFVKEDIVDPELLSGREVHRLKEMIKNNSLYFSSIHGMEEELTQDHKFLHTLPDNIKESVLSGKKKTLVAIYLAPYEKLLFNSLSLFIQMRMFMNCIGTTPKYDDPLLSYSVDKKDVYDLVMLCGFLTRIRNMGDCCMGCYINISQWVSKLDRELLFSRVCEHISSPEVIHLLRSFLNIDSVKTKGDPIPHNIGETGLIHVGALTIKLIDFYFNEFDFHFRKSEYFYNRVGFDLFIGIPINSLENSSVDIIQHSVENYIKDSLAKINITPDIVSCNFFTEGECISLFGGELRLLNKRFHFGKENTNNHEL